MVFLTMGSVFLIYSFYIYTNISPTKINDAINLVSIVNLARFIIWAYIVTLGEGFNAHF